jgi:hypothetical protein
MNSISADKTNVRVGGIRAPSPRHQRPRYRISSAPRMRAALGVGSMYEWRVFRPKQPDSAARSARWRQYVQVVCQRISSAIVIRQQAPDQAAAQLSCARSRQRHRRVRKKWVLAQVLCGLTQHPVRRPQVSAACARFCGENQGQRPIDKSFMATGWSQTAALQ